MRFIVWVLVCLWWLVFVVGIEGDRVCWYWLV